MYLGEKKSLRFRWIFSLFLFLIFFVSPTVAYAHATVVKSSPVAGQTLSSEPGTVQIWFDEAIQPNYFDLVVTNSDGTRADEHDAHLAPSNHALLECTIAHHISNGFYIAKWRAVSDDGHVVTGSIPFNVGTQTTISAPLSMNQSNQMPPLILTVTRWLEYLGLLLLTGLFVFWTFILPSQLREEKAFIARFFTLTSLLLGIATLAVALTLPIQVCLLTGKSFYHIWHIQIFKTMFESSFGRIWLYRMAILIILSCALYIGRKWTIGSRIGNVIVLSLAIILLATKSLTGHAFTSPYRAYSVIADVFHLIAASIWLGSLLGLAVLLPIGSVNKSISRESYWNTIRRFSIWGILTVLILSASGLFAAFVNVPDIYTLLHTVYGRSLILKIVLVAIMLLFAIRHLVKGNKQGYSKLLTKTIGIEFSVGLCVLLVTSLLTNLPSPKATPGPYVNAQMLPDGSSMTLRVTPNQAGVNDITVSLKSANGMMMTHVLKSSISFTSLDAYTGTSNVPLAVNHNGTYHLVGLYFPSAGRWYVTVHVEVSSTNDEYAHFEFLVGAPI